MRKCCVAGCSSDFSTPNITLFSVPPNIDELWLSVINRPVGWYPKKTTKICSQHFLDHQIGGETKRYLRPHAVPLPLPPIPVVGTGAFGLLGGLDLHSLIKTEDDEICQYGESDRLAEEDTISNRLLKTEDSESELVIGETLSGDEEEEEEEDDMDEFDLNRLVTVELKESDGENIDTGQGVRVTSPQFFHKQETCSKVGISTVNAQQPVHSEFEGGTNEIDIEELAEEVVTGAVGLRETEKNRKDGSVLPSDNTEVLWMKSEVDQDEKKPEQDPLALSANNEVSSVFRCDQCSFSSSWRRSLTYHIQSRHGLGFPCTDCHYKATNPSNLTRHKKLKHRYENNGPLSLNCSALSAGNMKVQPVGVSYHFPCVECGFTSNSLGGLKKHWTAKHSTYSKLSIQCDECAYVGTSMLNLKRHKARKHDVVHQLACGECSFTTHNSLDMKEHIYATH